VRADHARPHVQIGRPFPGPPARDGQDPGPGPRRAVHRHRHEPLPRAARPRRVARQSPASPGCPRVRPELARTNKFSHTADGRQPWERTVAQGYQDCIIAENIAWEFNSAGFTTRGLADALVEGWKKSPHHRKNMLDPDVGEIGVGVAYSKDTGRYYAVQDFGRPKSEEIVFSVADEADTPVRYTLDGKDGTIQPHYTITFQRCRPPGLTFHLPGQSKAAVFRPQSGDHYVLRSDAAGHDTVAEE
jgi:hypothetical protein